MAKFVLAFDMDDTFTHTGMYFNEKLLDILVQRGEKEKLSYVQSVMDSTSTMNYRADVKEIINNELVGPGYYMLEARPTSLASHHNFQTLRLLKEQYKDDLEVVVCSHRGFHLYGGKFTEHWLDKRYALDVFDAVHMLDSKDTPNKIDFLKDRYPESEILIVDDNPINTQDDTILEPIPEILIYDEVHKFDKFKNQARFTTFSDLCGHVEKRIWS